MAILDINKVMASIPQRYPMLMVDRIIEIDEGKRVVAIKNVTINEPFFKGHFPDNPIMPGCMIIEAMAQVSTFLFYIADKPSQKLAFYLGAVKETKFFKPVVPGDILTVTAESIRLAEDSAYVKVKATVKDEVISTGEMIFVRRK